MLTAPMLLRRYQVVASAVGQALWAVTPTAQRSPHPPAEDVDYLLDFEQIDIVGDNHPEALDGIIAWLEKMVSTIRRLTVSSHVVTLRHSLTHLLTSHAYLLTFTFIPCLIYLLTFFTYILVGLLIGSLTGLLASCRLAAELPQMVGVLLLARACNHWNSPLMQYVFWL